MKKYKTIKDYHTYDEWKSEDRYVKKGSKGKKFEDDYRTYFHISQTEDMYPHECGDDIHTWDGWIDKGRTVVKGAKKLYETGVPLFHISDTDELPRKRSSAWDKRVKGWDWNPGQRKC